MARLHRLVVPHHLHYLVQQGNDRQSIFRDTDDYVAFLNWLKEATRQFAVAVHAYVLMPDQLRLLLTPSDDTGLSKTMQWLGRHYVPYFNRKYDRTGTLWQGRYRATVIEAERYFIPGSCDIESKPVVAGLVPMASD